MQTLATAIDQLGYCLQQESHPIIVDKVLFLSSHRTPASEFG